MTGENPADSCVVWLLLVLVGAVSPGFGRNAFVIPLC